MSSVVCKLLHMQTIRQPEMPLLRLTSISISGNSSNKSSSSSRRQQGSKPNQRSRQPLP